MSNFVKYSYERFYQIGRVFGMLVIIIKNLVKFINIRQ